ncbi:DUF4116 domain-containing protein [Clostridioides sp. ZZV14-6045]|uniref:DUF4116 domain-containing protein n=1 Tax=Clostridioides sp. ZZV14-6045 TaxID=2811489 RepID=UPI001D12DB3D|nr:DUF4116 domain-containing protein [Clostridioides sp. ZZV14-6045]MDW0076971.1 DUF4116 domain-containing protein [Clostridioides difficile]
MKGIDLDCIKRYPWELEFADKQTYEMCVEALRRDGMLLEHVKFDELNLTKEQLYNLSLIAVKQNGLALQFVKEQTPEICIKAVRDDGRALQFVKEKTEEICIEAVKQNGRALKYVNNQTDEICIEAVKKNGSNLYCVKNQTPEICIEAIRQKGWALMDVKWGELEGKFSKEQLDEICVYALKQDKHLIKYIRNKEEYEDMFNIKYLKEQGNASEVFAVKENGIWLFTVGCQENITKETFIYRIYNTDGGFDLEKGINVHRQIYLDFLKEFK